MSSKTEFTQMPDNPPPYGQPGAVGMNAMPPTQPAVGLPQANPGYGYDQPGHIPYAVNNTNVVQLQPTAVGPTTVVVNNTEYMPSMAGYIWLSCFVFWCCNCLFGAIAFFFAIAGTSASTPNEARSRGRASMWINVAGICVTVLVGIIIVILFFTTAIFTETTATDVYNDYYG